MMQLHSMKRSKQELKDAESDLASPSEDEYPWGLRVSLEEDQLSKLDVGSAEPGDVVTVVAQATVKSVSSHEDDDGHSHSSMSLQITDMAVDTEASTEEQAGKLFPSMKS
jgi:hypothetical protein